MDDEIKTHIHTLQTAISELGLQMVELQRRYEQAKCFNIQLHNDIEILNAKLRGHQENFNAHKL